MSSKRSKRSESLDGDLTPAIAASSLKFSDQFESIQAKWNERLVTLQEKISKLEDTEGKASTPAKDALYSESELLRMDYLEEPDIATYYHAREKAPDTTARTSFTELPQGKLIEKWLAEHDEIRNRFKLPVIKNNGPLVILRMIAAVLYTFALFPIFFLMLPLRLLHPLLRACGLQNNHLPIDMVQKWFSRSFLAVSGVTCTWEGLDNLDRAAGTIGMFTHASNLDPFIIASGPLAFKWIGKKQLFQTPFIGWILAGWGHISIDRSNRAAAIASLDAAVQKIHTWGRNIAISPEGMRSTTGRLLDFKKGPFHIATQVGNPITPMLVFNAYELWSPHQIFVKPGHVTVRFLPQIPVSKADTPHTLQVKVRRAMLTNLAIPSDKLKPSPQYTNPQYDILFLPIAYFVTWIIYKYVKYSYF